MIYIGRDFKSPAFFIPHNHEKPLAKSKAKGTYHNIDFKPFNRIFFN